MWISAKQQNHKKSRMQGQATQQSLKDIYTGEKGYLVPEKKGKLGV